MNGASALHKDAGQGNYECALCSSAPCWNGCRA